MGKNSITTEFGVVFGTVVGFLATIGPRWWHEHSGLACCGTADGIQTIAQPVAVITGGTMGI